MNHHLLSTLFSYIIFSTLYIDLGSENVYQFTSDFKMDFEARREQHFVEKLEKWHNENKRVLITRDEYFETINDLITSQEAKDKRLR